MESVTRSRAAVSRPFERRQWATDRKSEPVTTRSPDSCAAPSPRSAAIQARSASPIFVSTMAAPWYAIANSALAWSWASPS